MPNMAPAKVMISPKATSTDECISPLGGTTNPAISRPAPIAIRATAHFNWVAFFFIAANHDLDFVPIAAVVLPGGAGCGSDGQAALDEVVAAVFEQFGSCRRLGLVPKHE